MFRVYRNHAAAIIRPFIFSFYFLSSFQTLKKFVRLFSVTVSPRKLKLGTHVDGEQMYCVNRNQAVLLIRLFNYSFFVSLQFSNIEILVIFSQEP